MNLVARQVYGNKKNTVWNTSIGGVSATITTASALATKLAISVGAISNFTIIGSDINCMITGSYVIQADCFFANNAIKFYYDNDNLISDIKDRAFQNALNFKKGIFNGITTITGNFVFGGGVNNKRLTLIMSNLVTANAVPFYYCGDCDFTLYAPNFRTIASSTGDNTSFYTILSTSILYVHPSLATSNSGGVEGDIAYAIGRGATVRYVTNLTNPNPATSITTGSIYNSAVQLNFTSPTGSTNAIDYYEVYINGVLSNNIYRSGDCVVGLSKNTNYNINIIAVDIFYNKSLVSNTVNATTSNYSYTDTEANTYISASGLTSSDEESAYSLISNLKSNSLWVKTQALWMFKGETEASQKLNAKNPIDSDSAFRLVFTGVGIFSSLGYQTKGTAYANTKFTPSVSQSLNSNGMTVVIGTNNTPPTSDTIEMGSYNSGPQESALLIKRNSAGQVAVTLNGTLLTDNSLNNAKGIWIGTKQSATVTKLFRNGGVRINGNSSGSLPNVPFFIGALNLNGNPYGHSNQRIQMAIIHEGLTDAEVTTLNSIIDLSEAIAGRKTW